MDDVLAILMSDLHLSHRPPLARTAEPDWYDAMDRQLKQVRDLQRIHRCPVVIAGDVFDSGWRAAGCPAELINFALKVLPDELYAVPGQHDLPHHRLQDLRKSAFCTLMKAGKLTYLAPNNPMQVTVKGSFVRLHGFPWGTEVRPRVRDGAGSMVLDVAVIHAYVWKIGTGHARAKDDDRSSSWRPKLSGFDVAHFGDNHVPMLTCKDGLTIFNPGSFFRRRIDEVEHRPRVGLLRVDGTVERHYLDVTADKFIDQQGVDLLGDRVADFEAIVDMLGGMLDSVADFEQSVRWALDKIDCPERVRLLVLDSFERSRKR